MRTRKIVSRSQFQAARVKAASANGRRPTRVRCFALWWEVNKRLQLHNSRDMSSQNKFVFRSQGKRVVGALLKVQEKLHLLETQLNDANSSEAINEETLGSELSKPLEAPQRSLRNTTPTLQSVNTRLELIEQKLDLVTQLLLSNLGDLHIENERKQSVQPIRFKINDENLRRNLMKRQLQDVLYNVGEEYNYLSE